MREKLPGIPCCAFGRRKFLLSTVAIACTLPFGATYAQEKKPVRVGLSMAQTGTLGGGGKAALLALQIWRDDVNARGGLLGRPVELVVYDDQSNPATTPGIYSKLADVDKVDLFIAPYGTNPTAPIMPLAKQRDWLLMGDFSLEVNEKIRHEKWFNNAPWSSAKDWADPFLNIGRQLGAKTIAILAANAEFAQNLASAVRKALPEYGLQSVYDQNYPPNTVDFSSMVRAVRAAKPDIVFVASYPSESTAIIRAANELGLGDSVKLFGGGMVGLQFAPIMENLGSALNGVVNYNTYVPERTMDFPGVGDFLKRYAEKAKEAKVDPLGFYLPPFNYATGQMLEQAVTATKSLDHNALAKYFKEHEMKTIVGPIRFGPNGEWANPRVVYVQFHGVTDKNVEQFRQSGKQVIVGPDLLKTGEVRPYYQAR